MDENAHDMAVVGDTDDAIALALAREQATLWETRANYLLAQAQRAEQERDKYQTQTLTLEAQLRALEAYAADLQTRLAQVQAALDAAQSTATALPRRASAAPYPPIIDIVDQLPRSPDPANRYPYRPLAQIRSLVIHHTGSDDPTATPQQIARFHVEDPKHQWPGIGFHFVITADGAIYQTNRLESACFHVVNNNATTAGIVLVGQFNGHAPAPVQISSAAALLAWLLQELKLPLESIVGHSEFADQQTDCPGTDWQAQSAWKTMLLDRIRDVAKTPRRPIYHYVLFWQTESAWAEADWQAASRYIARFRPTVGFSPQEASQAEHVTIIGEPTGVSPEIEETLRAAGCRVQRITAKKSSQLRAILDGMANAGQRFQK